MTKLPSWAWILAGLTISVTSWYVEMPLFFWTGWVFITVGAAKFFISYTTNKKETRQEEKQVQQYTRPRQTRQYYRCSCNNIIHINDNYCAKCGRRLR